MSTKNRETAPDMRLAGETYCSDCPDHEACGQGASCDFVRMMVEEEERLNRTNNFRIIDNPRGIFMAAPETEAEIDYDQDAIPGDESTYDVGIKVRAWLADITPEKILAYALLGAATISLMRPKRMRVDYHHYVHHIKK